MRAQNELLGSRARVRRRYALLPLEGIPSSRLPEWPGASVRVLAAPALGAAFAQYRIDLPAGSVGTHAADNTIEHFLFVLSGAADVQVTGGAHAVGFGTGSSSAGRESVHRLDSGGFALVPPSHGYRVAVAEDTALLVLRKRYEPTPAHPESPLFVGNENEVRGEVYLGDDGALLQTLVPDDDVFDLAVNIFTFEIGHSLPVTETHVMEHGLYVLEGKGLYYLDDMWMEVERDDFIWMGPFCPQSYYATGPTPTRYIYYKNVNREIAL